MVIGRWWNERNRRFACIPVQEIEHHIQSRHDTFLQGVESKIRRKIQTLKQDQNSLRMTENRNSMKDVTFVRTIVKVPISYFN
jgi:hypothetical protein